MRITYWQPLREILSTHSARLFRHQDDWCETPARQKPPTESSQGQRTQDGKQQDQANRFQSTIHFVKRLTDNDRICLCGRRNDSFGNHPALVVLLSLSCGLQTNFICSYRLESCRGRMNSVERRVVGNQGSILIEDGSGLPGSNMFLERFSCSFRCRCARPHFA